METSQTSVAAPAAAREPGGIWLILARWAWVGVALLLVGNFVFSIPPYYAALRTVCTVSGSVTAQCATWQLTPDNLLALTRLHISLDAYAAYTTSINVITSLLFWVVGLFTFWRKAREWLGLSVSLVLILLGSSGVTDSLQGVFMTANSPFILAALVLLFNVIQWPAFGLFLVTFPTGRFTPRWSWLLVLFWVGQLGYFWLTTFAPAFEIGIPVVVLITYGSTLGIQVYRYIWRYSAVQRQQVKWFLFVVLIGLLFDLATSAIGSLVMPLNAPDSWFKLLEGTFTALFFVTIPIGISISIFRYRLWDIDIIINRTLVYGLLTLILSLIYAGLVFGAQSVLVGLIGKNNGVIIVGATLIVAMLFRPLRRGIQNVIDRRFYRQRYDAARILQEFSTTFHQELDLEQLSEQIVAVVQKTVQPAHVSLWLLKPKAPQPQFEAGFKDRG